MTELKQDWTLEQWLANSLSKSISDLGYPVGMGISPSDDECLKAARLIFDIVETEFGAQFGSLQRVRAALNATAALSTESLEAGIVDRMISALHAISLFPGNVNHGKPGGANDAAMRGGMVMDMKKFADAILAEIGYK
jgi:hypothetical protein